MQNELVPVRSLSLKPSFDRVPAGHDVIALDGFVVVYKEASETPLDLECGRFYVVEYQLTRAPECSRIKVMRKVVRLNQSSKTPGLWWTQHPLSSLSDGPWQPIDIASMIIGQVVGFYSPAGDEPYSDQSGLTDRPDPIHA